VPEGYKRNRSSLGFCEYYVTKLHAGLVHLLEASAHQLKGLAQLANNQFRSGLIIGEGQVPPNDW
jgi:hypothetical protein